MTGDEVPVLGSLLACFFGRRLRNDFTFADGRHRKHHPRRWLFPGSKWRARQDSDL
jgi:hypothetical protein